MRSVESLKGISTGQLIRERDDLLERMNTFGSVGEDRMIIENMGTVLRKKGIPDDMTHEDYTEKYGVLGRGADLGHGLSTFFGRISGSSQPTNHSRHDYD